MDEQELVKKYNAGEREFSKAYLVRANLSGATLKEADLSEANLNEAYVGMGTYDRHLRPGPQLPNNATDRVGAVAFFATHDTDSEGEDGKFFTRSFQPEEWAMY